MVTDGRGCFHKNVPPDLHIAQCTLRDPSCSLLDTHTFNVSVKNEVKEEIEKRETLLTLTSSLKVEIQVSLEVSPLARV